MTFQVTDSLRRSLLQGRSWTGQQLELLAQATHEKALRRDRPARQPRTYELSESLARRRKLAALGLLPPQLAQVLTTAEQAVAAVLIFEHQEHGRCTQALINIAVRAGVCRRTVQRALHRLKELGIFDELTRPHRWARRSIGLAHQLVRSWLERRGAPLRRLDRTFSPPNSQHKSQMQNFADSSGQAREAPA